MKKIIKYKTIRVDVDFIDEPINDALVTGWQPYGNLQTHVLTEEHKEFIYAIQVMVKYKDDEL